MKYTFLILVLSLLAFGCKKSSEHNYQTLINKIKKQANIIELTTNNGNSRLIISPYHQGKIVASTYNGINGSINGWTDTSLLDSTTQISGGEERLWLGPLGSQFSFYYQQIKPLNEDNWKVPDEINQESYQLVTTTNNCVELTKQMHLTNFIGTTFNLKVDRKIKLFDKKSIQQNLNINFDDTTNFVAFETKNTLINKDTIPWTKTTGLIGLWSAGMYKGADDSVVIIPLKNHGTLDRSIYKYMGALDKSRLQLKNNTILFKGDGKYRSKIGVKPEYAPTIYGCYTKSINRLTIIEYKKNNDNLYANSYVSIQDKPYNGEAIPIYNNSENFYELESNSPLKPMQPNDSLIHWHRVYHFSGNKSNLNKISETLLGINLNDCTLKN